MASTYDVVTVHRSGSEHHRPYTPESELSPGAVIRLDGRDWLVESVAGSTVTAKPARYRLILRHPDGEEEAGAFRRFRSDAPRVGHMFSTNEDGRPISWEVVEERLARDGDGEPYLELMATRDFGEADDLPNHELEHALDSDGVPDAAAATLARADEGGMELELVALEPGEAPDWAESEAYVDALILEEIEDDLLEQCGVRPDSDPQDAWLGIVKSRLRDDLAAFRADVEGEQDEIQEWEFRDGRIFASVGTFEDESDPNKGHGWLCRLLDASALRAAGFRRVRRAELQG